MEFTSLRREQFKVAAIAVAGALISSCSAQTETQARPTLMLDLAPILSWASFGPMTLNLVVGKPYVMNLSGYIGAPEVFGCVEKYGYSACDPSFPKFTTPDELYTAIISAVERVRQFIDDNEVETIQLDSAGGVAIVGYWIAEIVHDRGIATVVSEDAACLSACVYILASGRSRRAEGIVGVHRLDARHVPLGAGDASLQYVLDEEMRVRRLVGYHPEMWRIQNDTPADFVHILSDEEKHRFGLR